MYVGPPQGPFVGNRIRDPIKFMAIRFRIMPKFRLALTVIRGRFSVDDLYKQREAIESSESYDPSFDLVFDGRRISAFDLEGSDIREFAQSLSPEHKRFARTAIIVSGDLGYALSRIFRATSGRQRDSTLKIFYGSKEAMDWIAEGRRAVADNRGDWPEGA